MSLHSSFDGDFIYREGFPRWASQLASERPEGGDIRMHYIEAMLSKAHGALLVSKSDRAKLLKCLETSKGGVYANFYYDSTQHKHTLNKLERKLFRRYVAIVKRYVGVSIVLTERGKVCWHGDYTERMTMHGSAFGLFVASVIK